MNRRVVWKGTFLGDIWRSGRIGGVWKTSGPGAYSVIQSKRGEHRI